MPHTSSADRISFHLLSGVVLSNESVAGFEVAMGLVNRGERAMTARDGAGLLRSRCACVQDSRRMDCMMGLVYL